MYKLCGACYLGVGSAMTISGIAYLTYLGEHIYWVVSISTSNEEVRCVRVRNMIASGLGLLFVGHSMKMLAKAVATIGECTRELNSCIN